MDEALVGRDLHLLVRLLFLAFGTLAASQIIGVITNYPNREEKYALQDPFVSEMIGGLENAIRSRGYYMMLRAAQNAPEIHQIAQTWNADGLIVMGLQANQCRELQEATNKPLVFVDCYFDPGEQYNNIGLDDQGGAAAGPSGSAEGSRDRLAGGPVFLYR